MTRLDSVIIRVPADIPAWRRRVRALAAALRLSPIAQSRIATAAAEFARAGSSAEVFLDHDGGRLHVRISGALRGKPESARLADEFRIEDSVVSLAMRLPADAPKRIQKLSKIAPDWREDQRELLHALTALRDCEAQLSASSLGEMRARFYSRLSDEFRTPLTSIMALTRLLANETDGSLSGEQHKQVDFIRKSAETLLEIGTDLLDRARAEAEQPAALPAQPPLPGTGCDLLVIDDEELPRYLIRQAVAGTMRLAEAADGPSGIEAARKLAPHAILLDLHMPAMSGFHAIEVLKADPATRTIPVAVMTAKPLTPGDLKRLKSHAAAVLSKEVLSEPDCAARISSALEVRPAVGRPKIARARS